MSCRRSPLITEVAVLRLGKSESQKKYVSVFPRVVEKVFDSCSVRNIAMVDLPVPGFPRSHKTLVTKLSAVDPWPEASQAVSSSVPSIHSQVPEARFPILRFSAFLSSSASVTKRSRRQSPASGLFAKASWKVVSRSHAYILT
jgi:hypothetical protein